MGKFPCHVTPRWDGGDLVPLWSEAAFAERWPESPELANHHAHVVHLHDNVRAQKHTGI